MALLPFMWSRYERGRGKRGIGMYIKDTYTGNVRKYGTDMHDSLRISNDGTCLTYHHLQCGDGSIEGDKEHSGFLFCDDEGHTPEEDEVLCRNGADAFFNIGGWKEPISDKYEYHIDHTDCIWYGNDSGCPVTCSQYRDGWNDAMEYIFKGGKGYQPYRREE